MRLNVAMEKLLERFRIDPLKPPPLEHELVQILRDGIVQVEGCWFLASQTVALSNNNREYFPDRTGYEAFINHIHISDVLGPGVEKSPERSLSQGVALGREIERLVAPWGEFEIVTATAIESPADCNVRFYCRRPGEIWIAQDLEGYHEEAILVFETPGVHTSSRRMNLPG